ncbi:hypothetical protein BpHYR1_050797 [Brachionus plicatilis]|uniref:Uncharacterized protein n=1 Tax=Brachionus plicatilis TaxID=10195 RepID=A0A3M7P6T1_BRAPC|nr:hypothetical protein BpHYR1_050797 [Brachionus plicatilis]
MEKLQISFKKLKRNEINSLYILYPFECLIKTFRLRSKKRSFLFNLKLQDKGSKENEKNFMA